MIAWTLFALGFYVFCGLIAAVAFSWLIDDLPGEVPWREHVGVVLLWPLALGAVVMQWHRIVQQRRSRKR